MRGVRGERKRVFVCLICTSSQEASSHWTGNFLSSSTLLYTIHTPTLHNPRTQPQKQTHSSAEKEGKGAKGRERGNGGKGERGGGKGYGGVGSLQNVNSLLPPAIPPPAMAAMTAQGPGMGMTLRPACAQTATW